MTGIGLSGAQVIVSENEAIKFSYDHAMRVVEQGEWLVTNAHAHLPHVKKVLSRGYVMEPLEAIPNHNVDLGKVVAALTKSVWRYAPTNMVDTPQTLLKVSRILEKFEPQLLAPAIEQLAYIRTTTDCLTHGDPTAENVMLRGETYIVIDPLPSTEAHMAGKISRAKSGRHGRPLPLPSTSSRTSSKSDSFGASFISFAPFHTPRRR